MHYRAAKRAGLVATAVLVLLSVLYTPVALADQAVSITGLNGDQAYSPDSISVNPGDTVTWTNQDPQGTHHNAVCGTDSCPVAMQPSGGRLLARGESATYTFQYSGTYNYKCAAHPNMTGRVVVSGDVKPQGTGAGTGSGSGGSATTGTSSGGTTTTSGNATKPSTSGGSTHSGSGTASKQSSSSNGAATDTVSTGRAVRDALAGVTLPRPNVIVHTAPGARTPQWVVFATAGTLVVCAVLFGLAWFGPPLRRSTT